MKTLDKVYYYVIPLLIVGISFRFTTFPIALLALLPLLVTSNRHTVGLFFLMYGGILGGVVRTMYPFIPVYGLLLGFLGLLLIWDVVSDMMRNHARSFFSMLILLAFFGFFYLIGPQDTFAHNKYYNMCFHGIMMLFGYYTFEKSNKIEVETLTRILLITSICMYTYAINVMSMIPGGLLDFNWFRSYFSAENVVNEADLIVGYQNIGMLILFAAVIFLSQIKVDKKKTLFYVLCAFELVMVSGCRQAILGVILAVVLRMILFKYSNYKKNTVGNRIVWLSISLVVVYFAVNYLFINIGSDVVSQTIQGGDLGRTLLWMDAFNIFKESPIIGTGIGGYHSITGVAYPHNFVLELLAETGIIGLFVSIIIIIGALSRTDHGIFHLTGSGQFYYFILLGLLVRVMVSSDLTESIDLYSAVFAITVHKNFLSIEKRIQYK